MRFPSTHCVAMAHSSGPPSLDSGLRWDSDRLAPNSKRKPGESPPGCWEPETPMRLVYLAFLRKPSARPPVCESSLLFFALSRAEDLMTFGPLKR
jgi:hypothetical protein